jgi:hypothetical protein
MPRAGYEPATPPTQRLQTDASARVATGIGSHYYVITTKSKYVLLFEIYQLFTSLFML